MMIAFRFFALIGAATLLAAPLSAAEPPPGRAVATSVSRARAPHVMRAVRIARPAARPAASASPVAEGGALVLVGLFAIGRTLRRRQFDHSFV